MATAAKPKPVAKTKDIAKAIASPTVIDAKQAVTKAVEYFREFFPVFAESNLLLEELEESTDEQCWLVTLGYDTPNRNRTPVLFGSDMTRCYKIFSINSATGKVISVKIRNV